MRKDSELQQLVRAAMLCAIGLALPFCFHGIKDAGSIFLPMHIPILIGGFLLKPKYAVAVGILTPVLSNLFTGMPPFPFLYVMVLELATYGLTISILYNTRKLGLYSSLIIGMIFGRIINIAGTYSIMHMIMGKPFKLNMVVTGLLIKGMPGIIIQIILIPIVIMALQKSFKMVVLDNE